MPYMHEMMSNNTYFVLSSIVVVEKCTVCIFVKESESAILYGIEREFVEENIFFRTNGWGLWDPSSIRAMSEPPFFVHWDFPSWRTAKDSAIDWPKKWKNSFQNFFWIWICFKLAKVQTEPSQWLVQSSLFAFGSKAVPKSSFVESELLDWVKNWYLDRWRVLKQNLRVTRRGCLQSWSSSSGLVKDFGWVKFLQCFVLETVLHY